MSKIYTGTKFFKYSGEGEDEKLDVLRITREENEKGIFGCIDLDGNKYWISKDELIDNYTMLKNDFHFNRVCIPLNRRNTKPNGIDFDEYGTLG